MTRLRRLIDRLVARWERLNRWLQLAVWVMLAGACYVWFDYTDYPPTDAHITIGVLATMILLASMMVEGTESWRPRAAGIAAVVLAVAGLMHLFARRYYDWLPPFHLWQLELVRALLVLGCATLVPSYVRWRWRKWRGRNGASPPSE